MTKKMVLRTIVIRTLIVCFWFGVSILFLLIPSIPTGITEKKSITVLSWPTLIDAEQLKQFEQETGIKVYLRYFENNEELYAKVKESGGVGYDLIMPSDYLLEEMIKQNLVKKIDRSKITFFNDLYPHLVGQYFDEKNEYSVPFFWSIYGLAIDKEHFGAKQPEPSWSLVFDPKLAQPHTCMIDDARELIMIAAQYLYGSAAMLTQAQFDEIQALLVQQKQWIEMYTEERSNYMLSSKASSVAVVFSAIIARSMRSNPNIGFMIPREGSFMVIDSFVMPKPTVKDAYVYQFLNFIYRTDVLKEGIKKYGFLSPIKNELLEANSIIPLPTQEQLKKIEFFRNILPKKEVSDIWIALKA